MAVHFFAEALTGSDTRAIEDAAIDRLRMNPYIRESRVSCHYASGVLLLKGRLPSYFQKQAAQEAVKGLEGVIDIVNEIEVLQ